MRKNTLYLLMILFPLFGMGQSQPANQPQPVQKQTNEIKYISIDYLQNTDFIYKSVEKFNNQVGVRIFNINKKLVTINQDVKSSNFNTDAPKLFDAFSSASLPTTKAGATGPGLALTKTLLTKAKLDTVQNAALKERLTALEAQFQSISKELNNIANLLNAYTDNYKVLKSALLYQSALLDLQKVCNEPYTKLETRVVDLTVNFLQTNGFTGIDDLKTDFPQLQSTDKQVNRTLMVHLIGYILKKLQDDFSTIQSKLSDSYIAEVKAQITDLANGIKKVQTDFSNNSLLDDLKRSTAVDQLTAGLGSSVDSYKSADYATLNKNVGQFADKGFSDLKNAFDYFNESNFTYFVTPQSINSDLTVIKVTITPKDDVPCTPFNRSYELDIRSRGGLKIDFSTGLFVNFGSGIIDQSYRYDSVAGDTNRSVITKAKSKSTYYPSLGALMHIYRRNGTNFQPALCFGVSTKDLNKLNYHLGLSLIMGTNQRFILNAGVTLAKTSLIDDKYYEGQVLNKSSAPNPIPVSDFSKLGGFFAITYNLAAK